MLPYGHFTSEPSLHIMNPRLEYKTVNPYLKIIFLTFSNGDQSYQRSLIINGDPKPISFSHISSLSQVGSSKTW